TRAALALLHALGRRIASPVGGRCGRNVARVEVDRRLQHREQQRDQQRRHHHEIDNRRARVVGLDPRTHRYLLLLTESMALDTASLICGSKMPRIATTRIAVITVTMTQPGTSPRSSRTRPRTDCSQAARYL